jgi:hypothetical protein
LFLNLKKFLADQSLRSDQRTKDVMQDRLKGLVANFSGEGMQKPVPRYNKYLNLHRDGVVKNFTARTVPTS